MKILQYKGREIVIYEFEEAEKLISILARSKAGDITRKRGRGKNFTEYYNYPCAYDIETTTIRPGTLDYKPKEKEAPPIAFPYLFQWNIYGKILMCRTYEQAQKVFDWIVYYFRLARNRRLVFFDHNLNYEYRFCKSLWKIDGAECFALDELHPVTIATTDGLYFRDSYKMTNMSLETLTKDWSKTWVKDKEIMNYSELRTPYDALPDNVYIYSALDVLSLSDGIGEYLKAQNERIWTRCPTSTGFIRAELKRRIGIGKKYVEMTEEQKQYRSILQDQKIDLDIFRLMERQARGGNTHVNAKYTGKLIKGVGHKDITSAHPAEMCLLPEFPLGIWYPMDKGSKIEDVQLLEENGYCCLFDIVLHNCRLKKRVPVPYISVSKMIIVNGAGLKMTDNGRYVRGIEDICISIYGIEWPIIAAQYDFDYAVILEGYYSKKGYIPRLVRDYIIDLYKKKTELKGIEGQEVEYALAKTYINGVFGMAYTSPLRDRYEVTAEEIRLADPEDPEAVLYKYQQTSSYFLPYCWGSMTSTLTRIFLQSMIDTCGFSDFLYCDTDSVFYKNPDKHIDGFKKLEAKRLKMYEGCSLNFTAYDKKGRPHTLGLIDDEPVCDLKSFGAKKYITVVDGKLYCTIAGVPKKPGAKIIGTPERFELGLRFPGSKTGKLCLWYNDAPAFELHDAQGRKIDCRDNIAMLPCDYLLGIGDDYREFLRVEGYTGIFFEEKDKNMNEDYI